MFFSFGFEIFQNAQQTNFQIKEENMNEVVRNAFSRRTIRKYTSEPIPDAMLRQLYEIIESTQSWANTQCWEIVRVCDPEIRQQLRTAVPKQNPAFHAIVDAPELFAICARKGVSGMINGESVSRYGDWFMYDLGIVTQNMCLAAHSLGLGTVVVGWFDHAEADRILHAPPDIEVVTLIPMGFRDQKGVVPRHKTVASFLHTDRFAT